MPATCLEGLAVHPQGDGRHRRAHAIPTGGWTVQELDERIAEVRGQYLETLESWPRDRR